VLPTVRELMRDAAGRLVAIDGRLWRTLYLLLLRPGMLTTEYLRGRRKRYVRPARLFFVMSLLLFAYVRMIADPTFVSIGSDTESEPATIAKGEKNAGSAAQLIRLAANRGRNRPYSSKRATRPSSTNSRKNFLGTAQAHRPLQTPEPR
jgi:hypothetical protein